jgi:hypothetical protein
MKDLQFDPNTRELVIENSNLAVTKDSSIQNGLIIRDAKCINVYFPTLGIGFNPINAQSTSINYELNRWKKQCISDGASVANFTASLSGIPNVVADINYSIKY